MPQTLAYLWAAPTSLLGLLLAGAARLTGGRAHLHSGVLEVSGGVVGWLLRHAVPLAGGAAALTLGHVVLGRSPEALERTRTHERAHVRQCERWGPLFVPAYLMASGWAVLRGRHAYTDNWFESCAHRDVSRDSRPLA